MSQTTCPACGSSGQYTLKDGRSQCTECRKKYTATTHRVRLPTEALQMVAESFWRKVPACTAAAEQGMNSKTLQRYYDLIRRAISEQNETGAMNRFGAARVAPALFRELSAKSNLPKEACPLFCLAQATGQAFLLFAADEAEAALARVNPTEVLGWVYAQNQATLRALDLDHMHFIPGSPADGADGRAFWVYAKRGLVKYHGGFRKNFPLFVHEMEFRFHADNEEAALSRLTEILLAV